MIAELSRPDWDEVATKADLRELELALRAEVHASARNQTWHLVTFVSAFNAVLVAVFGVVVASLG